MSGNSETLSVISLSKGGNITLSKHNKLLKKVIVGLGWDTQQYTGADFDLDASAFGLNQQDKILSPSWFIFYNQLESTDGTIKHLGDNIKGGDNGLGDSEQIIVDLENIPQPIKKIAFVVTIHEAQLRKQRFGQVDNAYIRIINHETEQEFARFELTDDASSETAMLFGELYRKDNEWKFRAVGQGYNQGLKGFCDKYGISVTE